MPWQALSSNLHSRLVQKPVAFIPVFLVMPFWHLGLLVALCGNGPAGSM